MKTKLFSWLLSFTLIIAILPLGGLNAKAYDIEIKSIEIDDISIIEYTKGYNNGEKYIYSNLYPSFTVTLNNGKTYRSNGSGVEIDGEWYYLNIDTSSQYSNPWTKGNTYTVTGTLMGASDEFNVTIVENPVQKIEIDDISIIEYTNGYKNGEKYIYNNLYPNFTVTLNNGKTYRSNGSGVKIDGEWYGLNIDTSSQYSNPWTKGHTYTVTGTLMGVNDEFNVTVVETPVQKIEIDDISIIEYTNGYKNGDRYIYGNLHPSFTVTLNNGKTYRSNGSSVKIDGEWYGLNIDTSSQYSNPWTKGNTYTVTGTLMGASYEFNVTIVETPVQKIEIDDISIIEYTNGYNDGEEYIYNSLYPNFTVTLNNGKTYRSNGGSGVEIDGEWYGLNIDTSSQYSNPWTKGNTYTVTGTLMGASYEFNVTIVETPVQKIEIDDISIIEYTKGHNDGDRYIYGNLYPSFTVTLNNGKIYRSNGSGVKIDGEWYGLNIDTSSQYSNPWTKGNTYTVTGTLMGVNDEFNVTIVETPVQSVEIEDVSVIVGAKSYYFRPKYSITLKSGENIKSNHGYITFDGDIYGLEYDTSYVDTTTIGKTFISTGTVLGRSDDFSITIVENPIESITAEKLRIFENKNTNNNSYYPYESVDLNIILKTGETLKREGYFIAIDGVDYYLDLPGQIDTTKWKVGECYNLSAELLGKEFAFECEIIPNEYKSVTLEQTDTLYLIFEKADGTTERQKVISYISRAGSGGGVEEDYYEDSMVTGTLKTDKGVFDMATFYYYPGQPQNTYLEIRDLKSDRINNCYWLRKQLKNQLADRIDDMPGDTNGDDEITDQDAIYTLFHFYFPEKYPINQSCDFNKDGKTTDQDAIYLLFYVYFPEKYPLQ